ncbi:sugar efflux transporter [Paractinoplanes rishiriensis]|uniref:MFS transporter n=1 Tax=Paractinoplanes rishiriensis TaxID=1050105 RepID=A0A919JZY4_9ACTN|nr:sugar efflux transporter [Actinoplanes rishiriensis]GIE96319.1 MFS transporter [Actinoplanes rishiriensis]
MAVPSAHRRLLALALIFVVVGLATSFVGPYFALFLTDSVGAGPLQTTAFLIVAPICGVVIASLVGRLSDRRPIRRQLLILAALAGVVGSALTAVVRDYWVLLALTATVTAFAGSLFPQTFAYARQVLQRTDPGRAAFGISTLRTIFSVAWVGGPPLAALVLAAGGFGYTYALAAAMYAIAAVVVLVGLPRLPVPAAGSVEVEAAEPAAARTTLWLVIAGITAVQTAATLNVQAMPLYVSADLDGTIRSAGLVLGLCAALEIPLMLGFGALGARVPLRRLILAGAVCAVAYQGVAWAATAVWMLAVAQVLQAAVIATVGALSITYVQDLLPGSPGRATTLVSNTFPVSQILSAPMFGLAQHFGFRFAYGIGLVLCLLGLALLVAGVRDRTTAAPEFRVAGRAASAAGS